MEEISEMDLLRRDLILRGYKSEEVEELISLPVLFIPGELTLPDSNTPNQKLTDQLVIVFKEIQKRDIKTFMALDKNSQRIYVEERHAFIDLGTICIGLNSLGNLANLAQIIDLLITIIQLRFSKNRNPELMPKIKYKLLIQNGQKSMSLDVQGEVDKLNEILPSKKVVEDIAKKFFDD